MKQKYLLAVAIATALPFVGCASKGKVGHLDGKDGEKDASTRLPFSSTYKPLPSESVLVEGATILDGVGGLIEGGKILVVDGKISAIGKELSLPENVVRVDAKGKWVTPGIIDVHSHLGVYASPHVRPHSDGNEMTSPVTSGVSAQHSIWPQDPQFTKALAGGVTTMLILPGSANLFGGIGVTVKNVPSRTVQGMKFPDAPYALKMACGENPKRVYGEKGGPATRMGSVEGYRNAWIEAVEYRDSLKNSKGKKPKRNLKWETLAGVLDGEILVHNHCYRADEMVQILDVAKEFGYKVTAFHHAVESYKIADILAKEGVCSAMWADWWGFKMEAFDGVRENVALVDHAGGCAIVHSDSAVGIQRLNQEAAKSMAAGNRMGFKITPEHAIRWITSNAAKALGIEKKTGSLEVGKAADLVVWNKTPFSVYSKAEKVFIDGALVYDRDDEDRQPMSDFELGILQLEQGE